LELAGLALVLAVCVAVRVVQLGTIPRIIAGDETDNLQNAYQIIDGTGPGIFGFDWKPGPILGLYPLAWTVQVFGNSVADFRMYPVILSLIAIVLFYLLARESMGVLAALAATALLGTNLWFLHFSRTAWDNMNAALFAVGACWATTRALKSGYWGWWVLTGLFTAGGLYGYFSGRPIFLSVALAAAVAVLARLVPWRRTLAGLAIAGVLAGALFAPMAAKIVDNWDYFNRRTNNVSVFKVQGDYEGDTSHWVIALRNLERNYRGLILQDGAEMSRGLWARYNPVNRAPLDLLTTPLFWLGLVVAAVRWRKTYTWWPFFAPMFMVEVFSTGTPDLARGLVSAPFYFLFIGMVFEEVLRRWTRPLARGAVALAVVGVVAVAGVINVRDYFHWQNRDVVQTQRLPGLDHCEFNLFRALARKATAVGRLVDGAEFDRLRKGLDCSPIVSNWLQQTTPPASGALGPAPAGGAGPGSG